VAIQQAIFSIMDGRFMSEQRGGVRMGGG
jgi:hypothetical protein